MCIAIDARRTVFDRAPTAADRDGRATKPKVVCIDSRFVGCECTSQHVDGYIHAKNAWVFRIRVVARC